MKANLDYCRQQVLRLGGLANFPAGAPAANELVSALMRHALSDAHVERIITTILDESKWCPTPADIRQTALDTMSDFTPKSRIGCKRCFGTGYVIGWRLITWSRDREHRTSEPITAEQAADLKGKLTHTQDVAEVASPCDCLRAARGSHAIRGGTEEAHERQDARGG